MGIVLEIITMLIQGVFALLFTSFAFSLGAETENRHGGYGYHEHDFEDDDDDHEEFAPMRELTMPESRHGCHDDYADCRVNRRQSCRISPRKCRKTCGRCEFAPERTLEEDLPEALEADFPVEAERQSYNFEDNDGEGNDDDDEDDDDDDDWSVNFNDGCNGCEKAPPV